MDTRRACSPKHLAEPNTVARCTATYLLNPVTTQTGKSQNKAHSRHRSAISPHLRSLRFLASRFGQSEISVTA